MYILDFVSVEFTYRKSYAPPAGAKCTTIADLVQDAVSVSPEADSQPVSDSLEADPIRGFDASSPVESAV